MVQDLLNIYFSKIAWRVLFGAKIVSTCAESTSIRRYSFPHEEAPAGWLPHARSFPLTSLWASQSCGAVRSEDGASVQLRIEFIADCEHHIMGASVVTSFLGRRLRHRPGRSTVTYRVWWIGIRCVTSVNFIRNYRVCVLRLNSCIGCIFVWKLCVSKDEHKWKRWIVIINGARGREKV